MPDKFHRETLLSLWSLASNLLSFVERNPMNLSRYQKLVKKNPQLPNILGIPSGTEFEGAISADAYAFWKKRREQDYVVTHLSDISVGQFPLGRLQEVIKARPAYPRLPTFQVLDVVRKVYYSRIDTEGFGFAHSELVVNVDGDDEINPIADVLKQIHVRSSGSGKTYKPDALVTYTLFVMHGEGSRTEMHVKVELFPANASLLIE